MITWAELTTGERLKFLRGEVTQNELAEMTGLSIWTIRNIEQDRPGRSATIATLMSLAQALGTDVAVLTGQRAPNTRERVDDRRALSAIDDCLTSPDNFPDIPGFGQLASSGEPPAVADLRAKLAQAWTDYWNGNYAELGAILPALIAEAKVATASYDGVRQEQSFAVLTELYQIAADAAVQLGSPRIAFAALNRAFPAAKQSGDVLLLSNLAGTLSWVYLRRGRLDTAEDVARSAAEAIEPSFGKSTHPHLAVWGNLVISAAVAASRSGGESKADAARDYLSMAHAAAHRIGQDTNFYQTTFGPTQAQIQAVGVAVATRDVGRALEISKHLTLPASLPKAAQARYLLDVAHAQLLARQEKAATDTLVHIDSVAPDWMRHQSLAVHIVEDLYVRERRSSTVRHLASKVGIQAR